MALEETWPGECGRRAGTSAVFLEKLWLPRGKRMQNEQIMLKPFGGSSYGVQGIYTILISPQIIN